MIIMQAYDLEVRNEWERSSTFTQDEKFSLAETVYTLNTNLIDIVAKENLYAPQFAGKPSVAKTKYLQTRRDENQDLGHIQCHKCWQYGHYAATCKSASGSRATDHFVHASTEGRQVRS